jgi:hypothetical protein
VSIFDEYERNAKQAERHAAATPNRVDRRAFLKVAAGWRDLSQRVAVGWPHLLEMEGRGER